MISLEAFLAVLGFGVVIDRVFGCLAEMRENALVCRVLGWQNDPFCRRPLDLYFVYFYRLRECLSDCVQVSVFEVGWVNEVDVSYLPAMMLLTLRLDGMGFAMILALTSYGEIEKQMGFDSSDVCLMANDGHHALASRSLACQEALALYCALVPPLLNPEAVISRASVCDLDSVQAVYRRGRRQVWA